MGANNFCVVLLLSVSLSVALAAVPPDMKTGKWHVHVVNGLSNGVLFAHCKSGDDDIGEHNIEHGLDIQWSFKENIFGNTLFWCFLRKPNNASASLDVFWHESVRYWLHYRCTLRGTCIWIAKDDGIYIKNIPDNTEDFVRKWD